MSTFLKALKEHYKQYEGNFNYENMLNAELDISRFYIFADQISNHFDLKGAIILSSGCGTAGDLFAFMDRGAKKTFGIETSHELAKLAYKRFEGTPYKPRVTIQVYDGYILPYPCNTFDIVVSMHVIEHTRSPKLYLEELFRVLKPGGILFLDVPNRYYHIEQHTNIPYIHYLPTFLRDQLIKFLLRPAFTNSLDQDTRYKLETYIDVHFPSPGYILWIYKKNFKAKHNLQLADAFFFSYSSDRLSYKYCIGGYLIGPARKQTTFRIVIRKLLCKDL